MNLLHNLVTNNVYTVLRQKLYQAYHNHTTYYTNPNTPILGCYTINTKCSLQTRDQTFNQHLISTNQLRFNDQITMTTAELRFNM